MTWSHGPIQQVVLLWFKGDTYIFLSSFLFWFSLKSIFSLKKQASLSGFAIKTNIYPQKPQTKEWTREKENHD